VPELPDVEGFRHVYMERALGHRIRGVTVRDPGVLRQTSETELNHRLCGHHFEAAIRHGKWLTAPAQGPAVVFHFGMTGSLGWSTESTDRHRHDRVIFDLDDGELRFRDMRKLRGIWLAKDQDAARAIMGRQGPDALSVSRGEFSAILRRHRGRVKPVLMDQKVVAGLGNLLVDEILWQARIHPLQPVSRLANVAINRIYNRMRSALRLSIPTARVPSRKGWLTSVRGRDGRCPRCRTLLRSAPIGGRTTYWCPRCQRAPRSRT
jgi:formamidopyrimidine-DNA glycosylase